MSELSGEPARRAARRLARRRRAADPDVGDDRTVEARDADPSRVRHGRRGLPVLDGAHRRRHADDVVAAVPRQRAGVLGLGSLACGAGLALLPRFSASGFLDAARRYGATEFNAIGAMLEILMRQPERDDDADTPLRLCYTGPAPERERQARDRRTIRAADRRRLRDVREPVRPDLAARFASVRNARHGAPASAARRRQRSPASRTAELLLRNPAVTPGYWNMPDETAAAITAGRLAAHRRSRDRGRGRRLHVRVAQEGSAAPPRREPVSARGGGRDRSAPERARVCGRRRPVRPVRGGDQGIRRDRRAGRLRRAARMGRRALVTVQSAALLAAIGRATAHADATGGQAQAAGPAIPTTNGTPKARSGRRGSGTDRRGRRRRGPSRCCTARRQ